MADSEYLDFDAAIVGAGMVGLTLAAALSSAGLRVAILDRQPPPLMLDESFDGRVSAIAAGSQRVLQGAGIWGRLAPYAEPILDIRVSDGDSPLFLHYDSRATREGPLGYIVENRHIRHALFAHLAQIPTIRLLAPATMVRAERGQAGATIETADAGVLRAPLLISAEGRNSRLRHEAGIRVSEWSYPQISIVCTAAHQQRHGGIAHERFLPAGPFAILPMVDDPATGDHRSSIVWTERAEIAPRLMALDSPGFDAELGRRFGSFLGEVRSTGPRWTYPLSAMHAERYID